MPVEQVIAVCHDSEGFVFVGYGNSPESAFNDLTSANEDEIADFNRVVFYTRLDTKMKIVFE